MFGGLWAYYASMHKILIMTLIPFCIQSCMLVLMFMQILAYTPYSKPSFPSCIFTSIPVFQPPQRILQLEAEQWISTESYRSPCLRRCPHGSLWGTNMQVIENSCRFPTLQQTTCGMESIKQKGKREDGFCKLGGQKGDVHFVGKYIYALIQCASKDLYHIVLQMALNLSITNIQSPV